MTEFVNPFDDANMASGGGLWDGKVVTILESKTTIERITRGDGSAVIDDRTGEPAIRNVWSITGVADDDEREITRTYSLGSLAPTADGEGFNRPDGTPGVLHKNSGAGQFATALKSAGFDVSLLFVDGKPKVSALRGARITMKGIDQTDRDGNVKKSKKGYSLQNFFPVAFHGFKDGVKGNGAAVDDGTRQAAADAVREVLAANGGTLSRTDLVKQLSKKLAGNSNLPTFVNLVSKGDLPGISTDGTSLSI